MLDHDFCHECGRIREDWSEKRAQAKGLRRSDIEDRTAEYRAWRMGFGAGCYVMDADQIEYRYEGDQLVPKYILELTRLDGDKVPPQSYLDAIRDRFTKRDGQFKAITSIAEKLGVDAVVVLFRHDLSEFWLFNLSNQTGWFRLSRGGYEKWLRSA